MVSWDYIATLGTRYIADRSLLAVPLAGTITLLWWLAISLPHNKLTGLIVVIGAAIGTCLGILWP